MQRVPGSVRTGLGAIVVGARRITDTMFYVAARTLAEMVDPAALQTALLSPKLTDIREVSVRIAVAVAHSAIDEGLASSEPSRDLEAAVRGAMYDATYPNYADTH